MARSATSTRSLVKKRSVDLSGYQKYWEMREKGATLNDNGQIVGKEKKVFRCMCCGSTTGCKGDYGGEPDISKCTPECQAHTKTTIAGRRIGGIYAENYVRIFGHD